MEKLKIELPVNDWNAVLGVLGQRPYNEVAVLIAEIKAQASSQLASQQATQIEAGA